MEKEQLEELVGFLHDRNPEVRRLAVNALLPYTPASNPKRTTIFASKDSNRKAGQLDQNIINDLKNLCEDQHLTAHDALSALINLTDADVVSEQVADTDFLIFLLSTIVDPSAILADLACMLWSNLTKLNSVCVSCLKLPLVGHSSIAEEESIQKKLKTSSTPMMDLTIELFARGESRKINKHANYDFLASVWANFSSYPDGRSYLLGISPYVKPPSDAPLAQISPFTEHPSIIRRGGSISAIKNCCFSTDAHRRIISEKPDGLEILASILLPLCGPEPFDADDEEHMPAEIQMLGSDKKSETDLALRHILIETLILLSTSAGIRQYLRDKRVYRVVQVLHLNETEEEVQEQIERLVNILMRDEPVTVAETAECEELQLVEV
ncbi:uncharacterized protein MELLADRAFT_101039 [Melampsora larici-populina 98AG31]|uniref:Protein HGH1 homolog n=1 Tax=Melampsora larici-populina (strain 98AG31 / pathotype 3-4-7) TaxID=747676 RepID=F4R3F2_MELLP|nr:uncharacterized protein MELLADRAFT_101039 [Melampsora larici-populina 98AG31]EGG12617.1 hypothetical protein MELLADRAFT_101039 [Melampsora larici-populina 98AG31]